MHDRRYCAGFSRAMHLSQALRWDEFAQENEALTPKNTIPWQKFTETAET